MIACYVQIYKLERAPMAAGVKGRFCPNDQCTHYRYSKADNIHTHGWYKTKRGRRRRFRCSVCGGTFSTTRGTVYHKLNASRQQVDQACHMSAEGIDISTIARILERAWNTINRWLERAREACRKFTDTHLRNYEIREPQADEIKTFINARKNVTWIMAVIEVTTRLWPTVATGKRTYKNIHQLFRDTFHKGFFNGRVLITTDGYKPYGWVLKRFFGPTCFYGQVVKKWKKNRVTKVDREIVIGERWQIEEALECSEDSEKLNTSFIERLNLTIRRNTSYLHRKTPCHARDPETLLGQLHLQQCYYNFIRPHLALKFGSEVWTPAMMAGIAKRKLTWRDILEARTTGLLSVLVYLNWYHAAEWKFAA